VTQSAVAGMSGGTQLLIPKTSWVHLAGISGMAVVVAAGLGQHVYLLRPRHAGFRFCSLTPILGG
jgi:hypothetical protein